MIGFCSCKLPVAGKNSSNGNGRVGVPADHADDRIDTMLPTQSMSLNPSEQ
jgi:hypothetical protein